MNLADLPNVNIEQIEKFKEIAGTSKDCSIIMLNLNEYNAEAEFPNGKLYKDYMEILNILLAEVGGKVLWQTEASATLIGNQKIHEALGIWYPSNQAFLNFDDSTILWEKYDIKKPGSKKGWLTQM